MVPLSYAYPQKNMVPFHRAYTHLVRLCKERVGHCFSKRFEDGGGLTREGPVYYDREDSIRKLAKEMWNMCLIQCRQPNKKTYHVNWGLFIPTVYGELGDG